ncbi:MAG: hypothetical protein Q9180_009385, partial [Flavoplaca navasiana]
CLVGGWFGDKYGRIKTIALGAGWAVIGACLQTSAMNATWMIFAGLINGWGIGILNAIVPVWATETAEHKSRGQFVVIEFTLNNLRLCPLSSFSLSSGSSPNLPVGWSVGNGWLTLLCPVMFKDIKENTYYVFAAANVITIPMVWALYPEWNHRTLEEMNLVFAADSIWNWEAERNFKILKEQNPELGQAAQRGHSALDAETGLPIRSSTARNMSLDVHGMSVVEEKQTFKHG